LLKVVFVSIVVVSFNSIIGKEGLIKNFDTSNVYFSFLAC
jgi:hypothetical protein